ncbi:MAG: DUF6106 family protein [Defluviitaleaceae bacterium]|nr:DUF6106 family protein [Defluviitaleaceae bacterium]
MADVFKEQLIKKNPSTKDKLTRAGIILAVVLVLVVSGFIIPQFAMFITFAAGFGAWFLLGRLKKEYEYILTNGELDIDVIYNKANRKRMFTGNIKDFEIMAHVEDNSHQNTLSVAQEKKDYSSGLVSERSYIFLTNYNGKRQSIIIEPNDEILQEMSKLLTRRKFHPKK